MLEVMNLELGNASSLHTPGHHAGALIEDARAEVAHSSIRFSLGFDTTQADIDHAMTALPKIVTRLQGISTIKIKETNQ